MSTQPKPYNLTDPMAEKWTEEAYELLKRRELTASIESKAGVKIARVDGKCPYCEDALHDTQVLTAVTEGTKGTLADDDRKEVGEEARYVPITVTCGCPIAHPGDPEKEGTGCGTTFLVWVLAK